MSYRRMGQSGLMVSRLCVGCMSFGEAGRGPHVWTLPDSDSRALIRMALEAGVNFFDTANVYSDGSSEEILGRALKDFARREDVVIATKVGGAVHGGPHGRGLSRKAILSQVERSLRRLGTDYIDLYQVHRWDLETPMEESLETLNDLVKAGKVRYLGASSMYAYQFAQALAWARYRPANPFISMQNHYNLLYREEEREMLRLCREAGVGVIPWSPLARGRLTRDFDESSFRSDNDEFGKRLHRGLNDADREVIQAVARVATRRGVPRAQVALAWLLAQPAVTAPIVGLTKASHLTDALASLSLVLDTDECRELEAAYIPHAPAGIE
ncbi:aldo/keto reductase [Hydrogenophaga laconesensis]|nr:aldo/keto reductase [Hydrogenophaga laconesensis]